MGWAQNRAERGGALPCGSVVEGLVDAELGEVLADVVDDLLELAVELEGFRDESVVRVTESDLRLVAAGDHDGVVRRQADDDAFGAVTPAGDLDAAEAFNLDAARGDESRSRDAPLRGGLADGGTGGLGFGVLVGHVGGGKEGCAGKGQLRAVRPWAPKRVKTMAWQSSQTTKWAEKQSAGLCPTPKVT